MAPINLREGKGRRGARRIAKRKKMRGRARRERGDGPRALYIFFSLEAAQVAACSRPMVSVASRRKERHREGGTLLGESKAGAARPGRGAERRSPRRPETESGRGPLSPLRPRTHPNPGLGEVGPDGDLLAGGHVGVAVPLEGGLQLLQLLAGEVRPLPPLPLLLGGVLGPRILALALLALLFLCEGGRENSGAENRGTSASQASPRSPRPAPAPLIINPRPAPAGSALLCGFSAARYGSCVLPSVCAPDADGAPLSACVLRVTGRGAAEVRPVPTSAARPSLSAAPARCCPLPLTLCPYHSSVSTRVIRPPASILFAFRIRVIRPSASILLMYPILSYSYRSPVLPVLFACTHPRYSPIRIHAPRHTIAYLYPHYLLSVPTLPAHCIHVIRPPYPFHSPICAHIIRQVFVRLYPFYLPSVPVPFGHPYPRYSPHIRPSVSTLLTLPCQYNPPSASQHSPVCTHITLRVIRPSAPLSLALYNRSLARSPHAVLLPQPSPPAPSRDRGAAGRGLRAARRLLPAASGLEVSEIVCTSSRCLAASREERACPGASAVAMASAGCW